MIEEIDPSDDDDDGNDRARKQLKRQSLVLQEELLLLPMNLDELPRDVAEQITHRHLLTLSVPNALLYMGVSSGENWAGLAQRLLRESNRLWRDFWNRDFPDIYSLLGDTDALPAWITRNPNLWGSSLAGVPYRSYYAWCTYFRRRCMHVLTWRYWAECQAFRMGNRRFRPMTTVYNAASMELVHHELEVESVSDSLPGVHPYFCWTPPYPGAQELYVNVSDVMRHIYVLARHANPARDPPFPELEYELGRNAGYKASVAFVTRENRIALPVNQNGIYSVFQCMRFVPEAWSFADETKYEFHHSEVQDGTTEAFLEWLVPLVELDQEGERVAAATLLSLNMGHVPRKYLPGGRNPMWFMGSSICVGCQSSQTTIQCAKCNRLYCGSNCHERTWQSHCKSCL
jgi:hypothetical protein